MTRAGTPFTKHCREGLEYFKTLACAEWRQVFEPRLDGVERILSKNAAYDHRGKLKSAEFRKRTALCAWYDAKARPVGKSCQVAI
jgi:hypothetical protein